MAKASVHHTVHTQVATPSSAPTHTLVTQTLDAVLFDLDGVVTQTVELHTAAWQELFDGYLARRATRDGRPFLPFDADADYRRYIDGKPRYEAVKSFLASRGITLPYGTPQDGPEEETICGLGNKKDAIFQDYLKRRGVKVFPTTIQLIQNLRARGIKTAVVSSSKNCSALLDAAGIRHLFDVQVDGVESARLHLQGKPAPDTFLTAAARLGADPARTVVVEDAIAGVQAARRGGFAVVIGVARADNRAALQENGADLVVADLAEIALSDDRPRSLPSENLPSALDCRAEITARLENKRLVVFLDYDGTLTPIVARPELAVLSEDTRRIVQELATRCPVAIVSGRDRADVQRLVQLDTIFYAGSHGFDIAGPQGMHLQYEQGIEFLPVLDQAEKELRRRLAPIVGALVERKKFSIAVHFRGVAPRDEGAVEKIVDTVLTRQPRLRKGYGKKIFELQPRLDWHKGKAVLWLLQALALNTTEVVPLYIGDDLTDEDAFVALADCGIGIVVAEAARPTSAQYALKNPDEVRAFLAYLITLTTAEPRRV